MPGFVLFLLDKTGLSHAPLAKVEDEDGAIAGHLAYINPLAANLSTEIGCVPIPTPFKPTHVSNAVERSRLT